MRKNKLKGIFLLSLSGILASMSCLGASAMNYKEILNKKNVSIATLGSAIVAGSYFLYDNIRLQRNMQNNGQLLATNCNLSVKNEINQENDNDQIENQFKINQLNQQGKEINSCMEISEIKGVKEISKEEKSGKGKNADITSLYVVKDEKDKLFVFSNGEKMRGKDLNSECFRWEKESGEIYFKIGNKFYKLGRIMMSQDDSKVESDDERHSGEQIDNVFFESNDKKRWNIDSLTDIDRNYNCTDEDILYQNDSWEALLFTQLFNEQV